MGDICNQQELFLQNLEDAGCSEQVCHTCLKMYELKQFQTLQNILSTHRKELLHQLHHIQYEIDCLDYLQTRLRK